MIPVAIQTFLPRFINLCALEIILGLYAFKLQFKFAVGKLSRIEKDHFRRSGQLGLLY